MLQVLLVDDEPLALAHLKRLVEAYQPAHVVGCASDGRSALKLCRSQQPDVVLMDIEMPGMNGLTLAQEVQAATSAQIIFVTAYDEYAAQAFDMQARDYVLKPIDEKRLHEALERARLQSIMMPILDAVDRTASQFMPFDRAAAVEPEGAVYWARTDGGMVRVPHANIQRIEACRDYVFIHTQRAKHMVRETMSNLEHTFAGTALSRVHRSHIVNLGLVEAVYLEDGRRTIELTCGTILPVGRRYYDALRGSLLTGAEAMAPDRPT